MGCDGARHAVPGILTHEHCRAAPGRVERPHLAPSFDEALFVEQAIGRKKYLPVDVMDGRLAGAKRHVHRAIVELVVPDLVEPDDEIEGVRWNDGGAIGGVEVPRQRAGGQRVIASAALQEVARERALGQREHRGARLQLVDLREDLAEPAQIGRIVGLLRRELRERDMDERSHG